MTALRPQNLLVASPGNYEQLILDLKKEIITAIQDSMVPVRYMSLKQASVYSGIGQKKLIDLAKMGKIRGKKRTDIPRGDWSFDKESIDKYWHRSFDDTKSKAKEILDQIKGNR